MENSNLIQDETLQAIADAIREVDGTKDEILVREYADRIKTLVETDILKLLGKYGDCQKLYLPTVTNYDGQHYTATWKDETINTGTLYSYNSIGQVTKSTSFSTLANTLSKSSFSNFSSNGIIARTGKNYSASAVPAGAQFYSINPSAGYFLQTPFLWNTSTWVVPSGKSGLSTAPRVYFDTEKLYVFAQPKQVDARCANNVNGGTGTVTFTSISSTKGADNSTYTYKINSGSEFKTTINGDYYGIMGYVIVGEPGAVIEVYNTSTGTTPSQTVTLNGSGYATGIFSSLALRLKAISGTIYRFSSSYF